MSRLAHAATATALPHPMAEPDLAEAFGDSFGTVPPTSLVYQRADANDDEYIPVVASTRTSERTVASDPAAAPAPFTPRVQDVEALMQQFDHDPVQVVIRILTLAHQVQQLADRATRAEDRFDRMAQIVTTLALSAPRQKEALENLAGSMTSALSAIRSLDREVSLRLNGGAGERSIELMRDSLDGLLAREVL